MLHHFTKGRAAANRGSAAWRACHFVARLVDVVANVLDLLFSVKVSADDVVGLNKGVELSLEILVLLGEEQGVLLESLVLGFQVEVSVHEGLVRVVDSFQVCVLAALVDLQTVVLCLEALKSGCQLVSSIVLVTIFRELHLLVLNKSCVGFLEVVNLDV